MYRESILMVTKVSTLELKDIAAKKIKVICLWLINVIRVDENTKKMASAMVIAIKNP